MHDVSQTSLTSRLRIPAVSGLVLASMISTANAEAIQGSSETDPLNISIELIAEGFEHPWAVAFLPDGRYLVSERSGQLKLVDPESGDISTLEGMPEVNNQGQGGLLDIVLHPDFGKASGDGTHDWIYFT